MTRVAFITGGASGIGAASARLLHDNGYFVYVGDVQADKGRALAQELERAEFLELNVREEAHFERAFARIVEQHDRLDCMVNNAAIVGVLGPIAKLPIEQYDYSQAVIQRSV